MEYKITLGSDLLSSLLFPDPLLGSMSPVKEGMEFVLVAVKDATHNDSKEKDIFFTYQSEGKRYAFNVYALRYITYDGKSIFDLINTGKAHTLATQFTVKSVSNRVDKNGAEVYALSSYERYAEYTKNTSAKDLTSGERDKIKAGRLKDGALPLKVIDIDKHILVEVV